MRATLLIFKALYIIRVLKDGSYVARLWNPLCWACLLTIAGFNGVYAVLNTIGKVVMQSLEATEGNKVPTETGVKSTI